MPRVCPAKATLFIRDCMTRYTAIMDTVRFGRALGFGARSVARTLVQAIDAARAEPPSGTRLSSGARAQPVATAGGPHARPAPARTASSLTESRGTTARNLQTRGPLEGVRRFRDSAVRPFTRLTGVLLLEIAGSFFAIFAVYGLNTMWRARAAWHAGSPDHRQFLGGALVLGVFGYFCISSFVRARRRERRR
jgi:hypothetical protein